MKKEDSRTYTVQEAADIFGICPPALRQRMRTGELPIGRVVRAGKRRKEYMIYKDLVERELTRLGGEQ